MGDVMQIRMNWIYEFANQIRDILEEEKELCVEDVVKSLGGNLILSSTPFEYDDVHGFIMRMGDESFELLMYEEDLKEYKKFKIVHMIGHLFLHMGYLINKDLWNEQTVYRDSIYYRWGQNVDDFEADMFACSYMMPRKKFREVSRKYILRLMWR